MNAERDLTEYNNLSSTLISLHEKFLKRKHELRRLLEETAARRMEALLFLAKANRLTRHLTGRQRYLSGLTYCLCDIKALIEQKETLPQVQDDSLHHLSLGEVLKQNGLAVLQMIDNIKKNLLRLDLLEMRCREILLSINKAMEAFRHEWRNIRRKIYPFGIFSILYRSLRRFFGNAYFSFRDMDDVAALGNITGLVLKVVDSPLI